MEYNNIYEVDLAILHAVSGGTGGGITSGQVETMIDSALTDYSTTQEVEAMIAASGGSEGSYVAVKSLSEITTPSEGLVANVIDYTDSASTVHFGTGEWIYDGTTWRPKKIWIERLTTAEKIAVYNYIWKRQSAPTYEEEFNVDIQCQVHWYSSDGYPKIFTSDVVTTWNGNNIVWAAIGSAGGDASNDRLEYIVLDETGSLTKGNRSIPKGKEPVWEVLTITDDGTVSGGNGYWLYQACFSNDYEFGYPMEQIKCVASGQTYYGTFISTVRFENETDIWEATGVITIGDETYVGVWGIDGNWTPYKKSFTKIEAGGGGGGGKTPLYLPWNRPATSAETQAVIDLMAECRQIHEASGNVYTLLEQYEFLTSDDAYWDTSGYGSPSIRYDYGDGSNPGLYMFFPKYMYQYGENTIGAYWFTLRENGDRNDAYWDISSSINRAVWSQNQQVQTIQYCTQAEYDAEGQQYGHDASRLYLIVPPSNN